MDSTVRYKQFTITVKVELESVTVNRYQISCHMRRVGDETKQPSFLFTSKKFASPQAAYEFGLQEAWTWIDEHEHD